LHASFFPIALLPAQDVLGGAHTHFGFSYARFYAHNGNLVFHCKHKTCIRWIQSVSQPHPFFCELNFGQTWKKEEAGECPISVIRSEQLSQKNNFFSYKKQWINCLPMVFFWGINFRWKKKFE
jgi:hypothetical protein